MSDGRILVLNAGSSSLKIALFDSTGEAEIATAQSNWNSNEPGGHEAALQTLLAGIDAESISSVGHRVVHGGDRFPSAMVIDHGVQAEIQALSRLAPLHNRSAIATIEAIARRFPGVPQVAAFDTAFHSTMPPRAYLYPLPYEWYERWGIRRFGFHGLSHAYCAARAAELLGRPLTTLRLVTCHLGSGCSLAAIAEGRSIATSMGFTPLDGLMMATRPGSLDPGILTFLLNAGHVTAPELEETLNQRSGLHGVSGLSGDMRDILAARAAGHERATVAFDLYVARLREAIAAMAATLGGLDALVFTAGVGEHASEVRAASCAGCGWFGMTLDPVANASATADAEIASPESRVRVLVLHTREELLVARETARLLHGAP